MSCVSADCLIFVVVSYFHISEAPVILHVNVFPVVRPRMRTGRGVQGAGTQVAEWIRVKRWLNEGWQEM